jgi:hypothetical protein
MRDILLQCSGLLPLAAAVTHGVLTETKVSGHDRASAAADAISPSLADPDGRLDRPRRALDRGPFDGVGVSPALDDRDVRLPVCLLRARHSLSRGGAYGNGFCNHFARRGCVGAGTLVAAGLIAVYFALAGSRLTVEDKNVRTDDISIAPQTPDDPDPEGQRPIWPIRSHGKFLIEIALPVRALRSRLRKA